MENKTVLLIWIFFLISLNSYGQNIGFGGDCMKRNSAKFAESLISFKGGDFVGELLNDNIKFVSVWEVDSIGIVKRFINIPFKNKIPKEREEEIDTLMNELEVFLRNEKVHFQKCYDISSEDLESIRNNLISELKLNEEPILINIGFPGLLMDTYLCEKNNKNSQTSKLCFLENQIKALLRY